MADTSTLTFYPLLHAMLRANSDPAEAARARDVINWTLDKTQAISNVLNLEETTLVSLAISHFHDFKEAPSRLFLGEAARKEEFPQSLETLLSGYDEFIKAVNLPPADSIDIASVFQTRVADYQKNQFIGMAQKAKQIVEVGIPATYKTPLQKGVQAARQYLLKELHSEAFSTEADVVGGTAGDLAEKLVPLYLQNKADHDANNLTIMTGIPYYDESVGGIDRKTLNFILGSTGQGKSAVARTIAYNAAEKGYCVLFNTLEYSTDEELLIFAAMHAHHPDFDNSYYFSKEKLRNGTLDAQELTFLKGDLKAHFKERFDTNLIIKAPRKDRSWPMIRSIIEAEYAVKPLDLVVLDYFQLLDLPARDPNTAMVAHVKEAKYMCLYHGDGNGFTMVSPAQGNQEGYAKAQANEGMWDATDIHQHKEMAKSADTVCYTFMPPELGAEGKIKLGFAKTRRHGPKAPQTIPITQSIGLVGGTKQKEPGDQQESVDKSQYKDKDIHKSLTKLQ